MDGDRVRDLRVAVARALEVSDSRARASSPGGGYVRLGASTTGATPMVPIEPGPRAGRLEPRAASDVDRQLLATAIDLLGSTPSGAALLTALRTHGAQLVAVDDAGFERAGGGSVDGAHHDPANEAILVRTDWLARNPPVAASAIAFAAVLAVDRTSGLLPGAREHRARALARVSAKTSEPPEIVAELVKQTTWELRVVAVTRGIVLQGQVLRELRAVDRAGGPIAIAALGANDQPTYDRVFRFLVEQGGPAYNVDRRTAAPFAI